MGRRHTTVVPFKGSESSFESLARDRMRRIKAQYLGRRAEVVALNSLFEGGFELLAWRIKILNIEVDIVAEGADGRVLLVEVKSRSHKSWSEHRWTKSQIDRLLRVRRHLESQMASRVDVLGFFVGPGDHVESFEIG